MAAFHPDSPNVNIFKIVLFKYQNKKMFLREWVPAEIVRVGTVVPNLYVRKYKFREAEQLALCTSSRFVVAELGQI